MRHVVPLVISPEILRPLPQVLWDVSCSICDKRQARWEHCKSGVRKGIPVCSLCWLYESEWGSSRRSGVYGIVCDVEEMSGGVFEKFENGRLMRCSDADRILSSIVVTSRILVYRRHGCG